MEELVKPAKCPICNSVPESRWKNYTYGMCFGSLRCPNGHHAERITYGAGSESRAKKMLTERWNASMQRIAEHCRDNEEDAKADLANSPRSAENGLSGEYAEKSLAEWEVETSEVTDK